MENLILEIRSVLMQVTSGYVGIVLWTIIFGITLDFIVRKTFLNKKLFLMAKKLKKEIEQQENFLQWQRPYIARNRYQRRVYPLLHAKRRR